VWHATCALDQRHHYVEGEIKTDENEIAHTTGPKITWSKDPAGNILSVLEEK